MSTEDRMGKEWNKVTRSIKPAGFSINQFFSCTSGWGRLRHCHQGWNQLQECGEVPSLLLLPKHRPGDLQSLQELGEVERLIAELLLWTKLLPLKKMHKCFWANNKKHLSMSAMLMKIGGLSSKTAAIQWRTIETEGCGTIVLQATNV